MTNAGRKPLICMATLLGAIDSGNRIGHLAGERRATSRASKFWVHERRGGRFRRGAVSATPALRRSNSRARWCNAVGRRNVALILGRTRQPRRRGATDRHSWSTATGGASCAPYVVTSEREQCCGLGSTALSDQFWTSRCACAASASRNPRTGRHCDRASPESPGAWHHVVPVPHFALFHVVGETDPTDSTRSEEIFAWIHGP